MDFKKSFKKALRREGVANQILASLPYAATAPMRFKHAPAKNESKKKTKNFEPLKMDKKNNSKLFSRIFSYIRRKK